MKDYTYVWWFMAIWFTLTLNQCQQSSYNRDIIKELREIKWELRSK